MAGSMRLCATALMLPLVLRAVEGVRRRNEAARAGWEELAPPALHHLWTSTDTLYHDGGPKPAPDVEHYVHEHCHHVDFFHTEEASAFDHAMMEVFVHGTLHPAEKFATGLASMCSLREIHSEAELAVCKSPEMVGVVHKTMGALELFKGEGKGWVQWGEAKVVSNLEADREPEHFNHLHGLQEAMAEESVTRRVKVEDQPAESSKSHAHDDAQHQNVLQTTLAALHLSDTLEHLEFAHKALEELELPGEVSSVIKTAKTIASRDYDAGKIRDVLGSVAGELEQHHIGDFAALNDIAQIAQLSQGLTAAVATMKAARNGGGADKKMLMDVVKGSDSMLKLANTWHKLPGDLCHSFTNFAHNAATFGHTAGQFSHALASYHR